MWVTTSTKKVWTITFWTLSLTRDLKSIQGHPSRFCEKKNKENATKWRSIFQTRIAWWGIQKQTPVFRHRPRKKCITLLSTAWFRQVWTRDEKPCRKKTLCTLNSIQCSMKTRTHKTSCSSSSTSFAQDPLFSWTTRRMFWRISL